MLCRTIGVALAFAWLVLGSYARADTDSDSDAGLDGGSDTDSGTDTGGDTGADTDTEPEDFCQNVDDPCCLDDALDEEVLSKSGCNGGPVGPVEYGELGGECRYEYDEVSGSTGDCVNTGLDDCWPYPNWFTEEGPVEAGNCGLCLRRCALFSGCPSGNTPEWYQYDFCTSNCPEGFRCWVYTVEENQYGMCMMDCLTDDDCSSGNCDPIWNICVPQVAECIGTDDTGGDSDSSYSTDHDGGGFGEEDDSGPQVGGCACGSAPGAPGVAASPIETLLGILDL
jgi:hypothetical protein